MGEIYRLTELSNNDEIYEYSTINITFDAITKEYMYDIENNYTLNNSISNKSIDTITITINIIDDLQQIYSETIEVDAEYRYVCIQTKNKLNAVDTESNDDTAVFYTHTYKNNVHTYLCEPKDIIVIVLNNNQIFDVYNLIHLRITFLVISSLNKVGYNLIHVLKYLRLQNCIMCFYDKEYNIDFILNQHCLITHIYYMTDDVQYYSELQDNKYEFIKCLEVDTMDNIIVSYNVYRRQTCSGSYSYKIQLTRIYICGHTIEIDYDNLYKTIVHIVNIFELYDFISYIPMPMNINNQLELSDVIPEWSTVEVIYKIQRVIFNKCQL